ncbi:IMP cyclohydrolase [Streptomyces sp. Agncl-13]|uniref:IMP cyclohydrolase n=1 Tax=Streptomyces sp. Agncl-13 TaxID=3400628 RepID=UPI003A8B8E44
MLDLHDLLSANPYPGRGVLCTRTHSGAVLGGYFLTGRSPASRDRALRLIDGELVVGPRTMGKHDPLRHYAAATATGGWLVLGNGEQVSQAAERLRAGAAPTEALSGFEYEPDPPIRTSRITALISRDGGRTAVFGAARPSRAARLTSNVMTLAVQDLEPGEAVLLTTYDSDGEQVSVAAPFTEAAVSARNAEELLDEIWSALDERFRIAAAVLDPAPGTRVGDPAICLSCDACSARLLPQRSLGRGSVRQTRVVDGRDAWETGRDRLPVTHSDLARRIHAVSHLESHFTLRSGRAATEYFDKYRFEGDPVLLDEIAQRMTPPATRSARCGYFTRTSILSDAAGPLPGIEHPAGRALG